MHTAVISLNYVKLASIFNEKTLKESLFFLVLFSTLSFDLQHVVGAEKGNGEHTSKTSERFFYKLFT